MINHIKNIVIVIFAFFILLIGNGVNLIEYCCNQCKDHATEMLLPVSCNKVHHEQEHGKDASCCLAHDDSEVLQSHDHKCQLTRFEIDQGSELPVNKQVSVALLAVLNFIDVSNILQPEEFSDCTVPPFKNIHYSGRSILNRNCILII